MDPWVTERKGALTHGEHSRGIVGPEMGPTMTFGKQAMPEQTRAVIEVKIAAPSSMREAMEGFLASRKRRRPDILQSTLDFYRGRLKYWVSYLKRNRLTRPDEIPPAAAEEAFEQYQNDFNRQTGQPLTRSGARMNRVDEALHGSTRID